MTVNVMALVSGVALYLVMHLKWWLLQRRTFTLQQSIRNLMLISAGLLVPAICFLTWDYFHFERQSFDSVRGLIVFLCTFETSAAIHWALTRKRRMRAPAENDF